MNEYDELMQDAASVNPYEQLLREQQDNDRTRMSITSREAAALPPEKSAEIIDISKKLKVPPSFVERNYDEFKKSKDIRVAEDFYDMALRHPAVQEWFTDKHKLAVAKDDLQNLGTVAWLLEAPKRSYQIGEAQVEFGNLRYRSIDGQLTAEEHKRLDELRKAMQFDVGAESLGGKALTLSSQQLPMLFNSLAAGFMTGAPTAMLAGGVAAAAGPASPVTVPIATGAGYIAGQTAGAAEFSFRQEAGHAYEEFSRFKDENGQPLDPATARVAALAAGAINAGLDLAQLGILLRSIPGADKLASIPGRLVVKKALEQQTTRQALIDFAKNYGGPLAAQAAIEVGQRAVTILAGEIGKATSGQKIEARDPGDILQDLGEEGVGALLGFSLIQAPGPLIRAGIDLKDAHNAKQRENFFLALGGTMEESKIRERVPAEMQQLVAKMVENGPIENLYVEPQVVQQYFQDKGIDPRAAMREVMGSAQPYEEALQTGHMLQIPTEQYASALAPTEHNAFFAKEMRFAPDELNQREVEQIAKEAEAQIKAEKEQQAQQQEAQTVADTVKAMLEQTGQDPKTAETMAAQMGAFFDTMAERTGAKGSGFELFKKYALDIFRRVTGKTEEPGTVKTEPEPLVIFDQSQKAVRLGAMGTVAHWITRNENHPKLNWQQLFAKPKEEALKDVAMVAERDYLDMRTPEARKAINTTDLKEYLEGLVNQGVGEMANPQVAEAIRNYRQDRARATRTLQGWVATQRAQVIESWADYMERENELYMLDSFFRHWVMKGLVEKLRPDRPDIPPPLDPAALAMTYQIIAADPQGQKFMTVYSKAMEEVVKDRSDQLTRVASNKAGKEWIKIPQTRETDPDFQTNTGILRSLSCSTWCTSRGMERTYVTTGDFWILRDNGQTELAIRFNGSGEDAVVAEVQGPANNGVIPADKIPDVQALRDSGEIAITKGSSAGKQLDEAMKVAKRLAKLEAMDEVKLISYFKDQIEIQEDGQIYWKPKIGYEGVRTLETILKSALGPRVTVVYSQDKHGSVRGVRDMDPALLQNIREFRINTDGIPTSIDTKTLQPKPRKLEYAYVRLPEGVSMPNLQRVEMALQITHYADLPNLTHVPSIEWLDADERSEWPPQVHTLATDSRFGIAHDVKVYYGGDVEGVHFTGIVIPETVTELDELNLTPGSIKAPGLKKVRHMAAHGYVIDEFYEDTHLSYQEVAFPKLESVDFMKIADWTTFRHHYPKLTTIGDLVFAPSNTELQNNRADDMYDGPKGEVQHVDIGQFKGMRTLEISTNNASWGYKIINTGKVKTLKEVHVQGTDAVLDLTNIVVNGRLEVTEGGKVLNPPEFLIHYGTDVETPWIRGVKYFGSLQVRSTYSKRDPDTQFVVPDVVAAASLGVTDGTLLPDLEALGASALPEEHAAKAYEALYGESRSWHTQRSPIEIFDLGYGSPLKTVEAPKLKTIFLPSVFKTNYVNLRSEMVFPALAEIKVDPLTGIPEGAKYDPEAPYPNRWPFLVVQNFGRLHSTDVSKKTVRDSMPGQFDLDGIEVDPRAHILRFNPDAAPYDSNKWYQMSGFHGTGATFDKFSTEFIGSGEGAQAHGWGLYFAGEMTTAHRYRTKLGKIRIGSLSPSESSYLFGDLQLQEFYRRQVSGQSALNMATIEHVLHNSKQREMAAMQQIDRARKLGEDPERFQIIVDREVTRQELLQDLINRGNLTLTKTGRLYEVSINADPTQMLDLPSEIPSEWSSEWDPSNPVHALLKNDIVLEALSQYAEGEPRTGRVLYNALVQMVDAGDDRIRKEVPKYASRDGTEPINSEELVSRWLFAKGVLGATTHGKQDGPVIVVYDESIVDIVGLHQRDGNGPKGRLTKLGENKFVIDLFEHADLSTFLHESGHFYLEVLRDLAGKHPQVAADLAILTKWMGAESADKIEVQHHEKFARGIETYFMEGKAPSAELRSVFARFRAWLMGLYHRLTALNAQLNDDVRAVMDRMFATDAAIAAAQREAQVDPVFLNAEMAGMRPEEFERYKELVQQAGNAAREELQTRLAKQYKREQETWWKAQRNIVRDEVLQEFAARNDVQATSILISGKLPDGSPVPEGIGSIKLARDSVVAVYGVATPKEPNVTEQLRRLGVYRGEGGVPLSVAAEILGYSSGDELIRAVLANANWRDQVEAEADARMKARYGDALTDGTLHEMAQAAVQNDRRAELLHAELRALVKKRNEVAPFVQEEKNRQRAAMEQGLATVRGVPPLETFQRLAQARVNAMQLRNIRPHTFLVAARQAAVEAIDAAVKGDYQVAASAKQKELFNMELYRVAINAREDVDSGLDYIRNLGSPAARKRFGTAGDVYVQQISDLLTRFDFAPATAVDIQRRLSLAEFIERMEREGEPVEIDQRLKDDAFRKPYKLMTYEEFVGVRDSFKNIDHLARLKNKLLKAKGNRELDRVVTDLQANINDNAPEGNKRDALKERLPQSEVSRFVGSFFAAHRKLASMVRQLDGWKDNGPAWEYIMLPLNEASSREATMIHEAGLKLAELFKPYTGAMDVAENTVTRLSLGLVESGMYKREYVPGIGASLSKMQRLMVALNTGNADSRTKLLNGYAWNDSQLEEVLRPLTKADWDFVQGVWDFVNTYWPQIEAKQKRVTGVAPDKVEASPVVTQWGEYRGGYFPLMYDDRISPQAFAHRAAEAAQRTLHGAYSRGTTKRGHTIERVEGVKMPVRLDFGVIFEHVHNVIHDLAFHEALIDVNRVLGNRQVQTAIMTNYGDQMYKAMHDAVNDTAAGEIPAITAFEKATNWLRHGVTIAAMGWNLMTGLMQPLGISQSVVRIGAPWMFKGFSRWIGDAARMENSVKWIHEQSEFMRNRYYTLNREINDLRNRIYGGAGTSVVTDSYFWLITRFQLVADVPTWLGAYERYMEETGGDSERAIALADQAVLDSQGGGQVKDLADVQRHGPLMRLWTNFYSYFNVTYNLTAESLGKAKLRDPVSVVRAAWELLLLYTVPAVLGFAIKDGMKGGEDLDDEELVKALMAEQAAYILGTMVGFREFSSVMQGFYGYEGPAGTRFYSEGVNLVKQAGQGETDEAFWKALNGTAGILLHYPAGQVQRTIDGYVATQEGRGTPINMLSGKPRE